MRVLVLVIALAAMVSAGTTYSLMRYSPLSEDDLERFLSLSPDIVHVYEDGSVDFVANDWERRRLMEMGLLCTTRIGDMEMFYRSRFGTAATMGGYMTWDELSDWLDDLHDTYPSVTSAPTSIGDTYQGRPQRVVKLSVNNDFWADDPSLPNVWIDGLIHAREPASMRNVRFFMLWLCENYGRNGYCGLEADWLLQNREIWCLPCNNVDGYVYNQQQSPGGGGMHRKNMNWSAGGDGIDLNRNWSVGWGGPGSSGSPSSSTYRGTGPLSEPECSNVDAFWQDHVPAEMHSTHTYGNILIYPWGHIDDPTTHAVEYDTHAEIMVQRSTGEEHGPSAQLLYYSSGNTRDHAYGLYGAMSWNHETGADFAGFWPGPTEVVKLTRRNLRSYLVTAHLAGCPLDPHEPGIPVVDPLGNVDPPFTVEWSSVPTASTYALQELAGYTVPLDDEGAGGPFTMSNWSVTTSQYHSSPSCYLSGGTGTLTWTETVTIPEDGGGRLSFWSYFDIPSGYCQGSVQYSTDGGANWYYLQTFTRDDRIWRRSIHELDEWQGETLSFRWETYGSSSDLYIDDIMVEVWEENEFVDTGVSGTSYTFQGHDTGEYWFRVAAIDPDFGPGWPSEPVYANILSTGIEEGEGTAPGPATGMGTVSPNPAGGMVSIPVSVAPSDRGCVFLGVYDLGGRMVRDLTASMAPEGHSVATWDASGSDTPDGVYFAVLRGPGTTVTRRVVLVAD